MEKKPLSVEVEISDFWGWSKWLVEDNAAASRWMDQNKDTWVLWFTSALRGEERALRDFKIYSNYSPSEKSKHHCYLMRQLLDIVAMVRKADKEEAQPREKSGDFQSNDQEKPKRVDTLIPNVDTKRF